MTMMRHLQCGAGRQGNPRMALRQGHPPGLVMGCYHVDPCLRIFSPFSHGYSSPIRSHDVASGQCLNDHGLVDALSRSTSSIL